MTIIITGASKGIGYSIAKKFLKEYPSGLQLAICSRNKVEINQAKVKLEECNPHASVLAMQCDVSQENDVKEFIAAVHAAFGAVDLLVNNAGFGTFKPVEEFSHEEFNAVIATNLRGVFLVTREVLPLMREHRQGTIITIGSLASKHGFVGGSAYTAAKFGVRGLMQSLFLEVREENIRVVTLFPGSVDTDFFVDPAAQSIKSPKTLQPENIAECVYLSYTLPSYADITELDIRPTNPKGR